MTSKYSTLHFRGTPLQTYIDKKGVRWWHLGELACLLGLKEEEAQSIATSKQGNYDPPSIDCCVPFPGTIGGAVATNEAGALRLADAAYAQAPSCFVKGSHAELFLRWLRDNTVPQLPQVPPLVQELCKMLGSRELEYGPADLMFSEIAERWSATFKQPVTSKQVALCMIDLKLARLSRNVDHKDSLLDLIGYALCYARLKGWAD